MAADALDNHRGDRKVGAIIALGGDRTVFTFHDAYVDDGARPTLTLCFKDAMGEQARPWLAPRAVISLSLSERRESFSASPRSRRVEQRA